MLDIKIRNRHLLLKITQYIKIKIKENAKFTFLNL